MEQGLNTRPLFVASCILGIGFLFYLNDGIFTQVEENYPLITGADLSKKEYKGKKKK